MYKIQYFNSKKMCVPVDNLQEYKAIRNSAMNLQHLDKARQGDSKEKAKLVQFNYSCIPNADGTLAGSKRLSHFVGMDVDFKESDPDYAEKKANAPQVILAKKDELGLMLLERSVSQGFHIVFRRHPEMTQIENIEWASNLLGIMFDEGAKDCTRVFFSTSASDDDLLFIDEAIFDNSECVCSVENASAVKTQKVRKSVEKSAAKADSKADVKADTKTDASASAKTTAKAETASETSLAAFDYFVKEAHLDPSSLDIWGEHNWHNNLLAVLSTGLPKLVTKSQLKAVLSVRMPNYAQFDDCQQLLDSFYDNYKTQNSYMSKSLREINAKMQGCAVKSEDENDKPKVSSVLVPPPLPKKLPRIIDLCISNYDPRYREMLAMACLPTLSVLASTYKATNFMGKESEPQQYVVVVGGSGQGKGTVTDLYNDMTENTIRKDDLMEMEKVRANADERDRMKNKKECPAKYHPKLHTFETISKSSIQELMHNLGPSGILLGFFSEADVLFKGNQQAFSDTSSMSRKGWDGDYVTQYYLSDSTFNGSVKMRLAYLVSGTPQAVLERMLSDTENGMMQRFIPVPTPKAIKSLIPPKQNLLTDDEKTERDALLCQLYQKNKDNGENIVMLDLTEVNNAVEKWMNEVNMLYQQDVISDAEASLFRRCPHFFFRAAIPLVALYGKVTPEILDFCEWVGRTAHYNLCTLFAQRVEGDMEKGRKLMNNIQNDARATALPVLCDLPPVFTTKEFNEARTANGLSSNSKGLLNHYCKQGYIVRIRHGVYMKKV